MSKKTRDQIRGVYQGAWINAFRHTWNNRHIKGPVGRWHDRQFLRTAIRRIRAERGET